MALQDIPNFDPNALVDPKTGQPYHYGSPEYQAAIMPYLAQQLQGQAERAANARGGFYSGPALADEQQAESGLMFNVAQAGAAQSAQEEQLTEEQKFAAQQQLAQEQAAMDLARKTGSANLTAGAVGGGMQGLGSLGGMYAAGKFFGPKAVTPAGHGVEIMDTSNPLGEAGYEAPTVGPSSGIDSIPFSVGGDTVPSGAGMLAAPADTTLPAFDFSLAPTDAMMGTQYAGAAPEAVAGVPSAAADAAAADGGGYGLGSLLGPAAAGAMGGLEGYKIGGGGGVPAEIGAGLGGLGGTIGGAALGSMILPGVGTVLGAGLGAFGGSAAGKQVGNFFGHLF